MNVLGVETSCDETSVAVVKDGTDILAHKVSSSLKLHARYGGVVPEIASRKQLELITLLAHETLKESGLTLRKIGLVSVTSSPGLLGSLLVGVSFAKAVALCSKIPLIGVNHVHSHMYANFLNGSGVRFPFVALVVSGGHTCLFYVERFHKISLLGQTQDDACGEAFDKVAKILGLGYPGGPLIERLAAQGEAGKIKFNCSGTKGPLDFSFSGIKTAVLYYVKKHCMLSGPESTVHSSRSAIETNKKLLADVAASFQEAVIDTLIRKSFYACKIKKATRLVIGGGVVANKRLRQKFLQEAKKAGIAAFFPARELCMDNAAMVAGFGYQLFKAGIRSRMDLTALS
jgi:N6-L-threonylcarbamoyladenine synthase